MAGQGVALESNEVDEIMRVGVQIENAFKYLINIHNVDLPTLYRKVANIVEGYPFTEEDIDHAKTMSKQYLELASEKVEEAQGIGEQYPGSDFIKKYLINIEKLFKDISEKASDDYIDERVKSCRS